MLFGFDYTRLLKKRYTDTLPLFLQTSACVNPIIIRRSEPPRERDALSLSDRAEHRDGWLRRRRRRSIAGTADHGATEPINSHAWASDDRVDSRISPHKKGWCCSHCVAFLACCLGGRDTAPSQHDLLTTLRHQRTFVTPPRRDDGAKESTWRTPNGAPCVRLALLHHHTRSLHFFSLPFCSLRQPIHTLSCQRSGCVVFLFLFFLVQFDRKIAAKHKQQRIHSVV